MVGHLCRMNETRNPKIVYEWELEGRRPRGQPMSWEQNIHQAMRNLDITTEDAQYRDRLRTIISGKRNLLRSWL